MSTNIFYLAVPALLVASGVSAAEKRVKMESLPPAVQKTVQEQAKGATIRGLSIEIEDGKTFYEAELKVNDHNKDVLIDPNGAVVEIEEEVALDSLPAAAKDAIQKRAAKGQIVLVESVSKNDAVVAYEAKIKTAGEDVRGQSEPGRLPGEGAVRVLLVEDEPRVAGFIAKGLREQTYAVDVARDGPEALYSAGVNDYDLVILDVMLPVKDGYHVCRELRGSGVRTPILMLTARDAVDDRVRGLDCGADDYLTKPFDFKELLARLRALARRTTEIRPEVIRVADLTLNTANHTAGRAGKPISLTAKEYALLEFLLLNQDRIVNRQQIAEHVWDENFDPFSNIIDVYIRRLRAKIDAGFEKPLIHTRRGTGYILTAEPVAADD